MKKTIALLLALVMVLGILVGCTGNNDPTKPTDNKPTDNDKPTESTSEDIVQFEGEYVYKDAVSTMATNWNPHTYQTQDDAYPAEFVRTGLYGFIFNDDLNPVEGKEPFSGYKIIPEMAAAEPVDVTEKVASEGKFKIPEGMTSGYAYVIDLNPNAKWEDGTPITADDYIYSMKQLLDPKLKNYRATDYYSGNLSIQGAEEYAKQGQTTIEQNAPGSVIKYQKADLVLKDGQYYTAEDYPVYIGLNIALDWTSGNTLKKYYDAYGSNYFGTKYWAQLEAMMDSDGLVPLTDETWEMLKDVTTTNENWGETEADMPNYLAYKKLWADVDYDASVGCYKTGDYQITLVLNKSLKGFYLLYNLSSNWLVNETLYEKFKKQDTASGTWTSEYNQSVESTLSYGPYKLVTYQTDKQMVFEKNENWYGYTDGKHIYRDPEDGKIYPMYMTTKIDCQAVPEANTRKQMFLHGQLMAYGLQSDDFATYRSSEQCYATPNETIFFLVFNGNLDVLAEREKNDGFDTKTKDLQTMALKSFKEAMSLVYDKELLASTLSPSRSGGYGLIGNSYIYDPETGARYRDTEQAKKALCTYYQVDVSKYNSLDEAVASITGYDPVQAKEFLKKAFDEAIEKGYITDEDKDGISDQTVTIEYCASKVTDFITKTVKYLNDKALEVAEGTPFEGKIAFVVSAPYDTEWSKKLKAGLSDTCLCGWSGSALDPFGLSDLYVNKSYQYNQWFDATTVNLELEINGEKITMNLRQWSDALNGQAVEVTAADGSKKTYNFGDGQVDVDTRLDILAAIEVEVLKTGDYIPILQDASMALLSYQVYYVVDEYNPIMGRGGIAYLKYSYNETDWAAYVASQGELKY